MNLDQARRRDDRYPRKLWIYARRYFMAVGMLVTALFAFAVSMAPDVTPEKLPGTIVLSAVFKPGLAEAAGRPSLSQPLLKPAPTLREIIAALDAGAKDARVKGFVAKLENAHLNLAQIQELREAVHAFRKAGKFAWIYSESFGTFSPGMGDYYFASAFDRVWMQPVGAVAITGIAAEVPFGKTLLDKLGVNPQFSHKGTYKSFPEMMTRTGMSDANREMTSAIVGDLARQVEDGAGADRGFKPGQLRALIDAAPFSDADAEKAHLVDRLGYYDEMLDEAKKQAGVDDKGFVSLAHYTDAGKGLSGLLQEDADKKAGPKIALITGVGDIVSYGGAQAAGFGGGGMAADKITAAFRAAEQDNDVKAVVFRLDTPGGSPEAAETIRRAVLSMQKKGRPVVVSMGGTAASGGYWVAAAADRIVADPATLTGSIGVFGGKMDLSGLWDKIGLSWDSVAEGKNARMWSSNRPFTPEETEKFESLLDGIYKSFIARVAEGRHMTPEKVEAVAEGRVWTGAQAKERGLVDELGGLARAVELARSLAKLDASVPVAEFPRRKSGLEEIAAFLTGDESVLSLLPLDVKAEDIVRAELQKQNAVLRMPEPGVR